MSLARLARFAVMLLVVILLAASGIYVIVYLTRWEWNRAIVSGVFFLSSLVLLSTLLVLRSIRRLEGRIDRVEGTRSTVTEENARRASRHFDWLRKPPDHLGVFIPVLFGAGVLLSLTAYVLERVAGALAGPTLDARTARLVAPDLPLGDESSRSIDTPEPVPASRRWWGVVAAVALSAIVIAVAVDQIGDATQTRPEVEAYPGMTRIELEIAQRSDIRPSIEVAGALWAACHQGLPGQVALAELTPVGDRRVALVLDHGLGSFEERSFTGCLEDLTLDFVRADVESVVMVPPRAGS